MRQRRTISPTLNCGAILTLVFALSGCNTYPIAEAGPVVAQAIPEMGQQSFNHATDFNNYILRPADVISVTVFREESLSLDRVPISADGLIALPLLGEIRASGVTAAELSDQLETILGERYLREPNVSINVLGYGSHQLTIEGAVRNPGIYEFRPGTRLSGSVALANGLTRVSDYRNVAIFRQMEGGMYVAKFDYAAVRDGTMLDPVIQPGDRVVVGSSGLSQAWQDFITALPVFTLFTRI
ncbi:polysaccharide biosynthesis/export family protein [Aurantiacibacter zhengii]|uniref:polysaccharide biosynthesis/export family protein n=1 Tax=Aurantiacibacter zhengii TaxID=2307003 RepID=UPI0013148A2E|nr:polysaccharide biosynthesis/export family protein [Aurantiacibacter zhengii]